MEHKNLMFYPQIQGHISDFIGIKIKEWKKSPLYGTRTKKPNEDYAICLLETKVSLPKYIKLGLGYP